MYSRLLHSFLVIAQQGSITKAADSLNVSQPALTKSMQKLESDIGAKLFDRDPKGIMLTKSGEVLLHHASVMENEYRHALSQIKEFSGITGRELRIGAGPIWLVSILPPLMAQLQKTYPDVRISLVGGVIDTLVPAIVSGELDLICVSLDFPERSELQQIPLFEVNHVVVADPGHELAGRTGVTAKDLSQHRWLTLKSDYVGTQRISAFFAANGQQPPNISLETTSIHSLLEMLRYGNYVAHIPEQMLGLAQDKGLCQIDLESTLWQTRMGLAVRRTTKPSRILASFVEILKDATAAPKDPSS
ncbi:MAG: LysR family transcriptional regulator [Spongiibacteraceae bacterium]